MPHDEAAVEGYFATMIDRLSSAVIGRSNPHDGLRMCKTASAGSIPIEFIADKLISNSLAGDWAGGYKFRGSYVQFTRCFSQRVAK